MTPVEALAEALNQHIIRAETPTGLVFTDAGRADMATGILAVLPEGWSLTTTPDPDARLLALREALAELVAYTAEWGEADTAEDVMLSRIRAVLTDSQPLADKIAADLRAEGAKAERNANAPVADAFLRWVRQYHSTAKDHRPGSWKFCPNLWCAEARALLADTTPTEGKARQLADFIGVAPNLLYDAPMGATTTEAPATGLPPGLTLTATGWEALDSLAPPAFPDAPELTVKAHSGRRRKTALLLADVEAAAVRVAKQDILDAFKQAFEEHDQRDEGEAES